MICIFCTDMMKSLDIHIAHTHTHTCSVVVSRSIVGTYLMTVVVVLLDRNRDKPGRIINTTNLETWNAFAVAFRNGVLFIASVHWLI